MNEEPIIAIVPAAGIGARARGPIDDDRPKQYRLLNGQPMLRLAVEALLADRRVSEVRVAVGKDDAWADDALAGLPRTVVRRCGGETRAQTVLQALADSGVSDHVWVLVHDAARPGLPTDALARLIEACVAQDAGGLLALPVADTVKRGVADVAPPGMPPTTLARVSATLDRDGLWLAQTPQLYRAGALRGALGEARMAGRTVTDESQAMEAAGVAPLLVRGAVRNFKVTWPEDFELMEKWL